MGQEYEKKKQWGKAFKCYEKALQVNLNDPNAKWYKEELLKKSNVLRMRPCREIKPFVRRTKTKYKYTDN